MPAPLFVLKRHLPGGVNNKTIKFACHVNRRETKQGKGIKLKSGGFACTQCMAHSGAVFGDARPIKGKQRCRRPSCSNSLFCFAHLRTICKMRIARSLFLDDNTPVNGLGLYAVGTKVANIDDNVPVFEKGDYIGSGLSNRALYDGETLEKEVLNKRYDYKNDSGEHIEPTAPYALMINADNYTDSACVRGPLAMMNSAKKAIIQVNAWLLPDGGCLFLKDIYHGDELIVYYGDDYWINIENTKHTTSIQKTGGWNNTYVWPYETTDPYAVLGNRPTKTKRTKVKRRSKVPRADLKAATYVHIE